MLPVLVTITAKISATIHKAKNLGHTNTIFMKTQKPSSTVLHANIAHNLDSCWKFAKASEYANVYWASTSKCKIVSFLSGIQLNRFFFGKVLSMLPPQSVRKKRYNGKTHSKNFFPKNKNDVSVTSSCIQELTQLTETKNWTGRTVWTNVFCVCCNFYQTPPKTKF